MTLLPPSGSMIVPRQDLADFMVPTRSIESLFLQHAMLSLKPGGRAAMIIPEGLLFRNGAECELRQKLLAEFRVEAVISLPPGAISPYTYGKANILIFHKNGPTQRVWFFDARNSDEDLDILQKQWSDKQETVRSWSANVESISQTDYILSANRYQPGQARTGPHNWVALDKLRTIVKGSQLPMTSSINGLQSDSMGGACYATQFMVARFVPKENSRRLEWGR